MGATKKLKSKYVVLMLDCADGLQNGEQNAVPVVKAEYQSVLKATKRFSYPSVFVLNAPGDKLLYSCVGGWNEPSDVLRLIRRELKDIDVLEGITAEGDDEESQESFGIETWKNAAGNSMKAEALRIDGDSVVFKMESGKEIRYALKKLSDGSRERLDGRFGSE